MKLELADFQKAYLDMHRDASAAPGLSAEEDDFVMRLWGPGTEGYNYNWVLKEPARDYAQLVFDEKEIMLDRDKRKGWWKVHDFPADTRAEMEQALGESGFSLLRKTRLMYLPVDGVVNPASSVEVMRLKPTDSMDLVREVSMDVWGEVSDSLMEGLHNGTQGENPKTQVFLSRLKGDSEWASVGWVNFAGKVGHFFGGSTREKHRGMGTYRTLVAARLKASAEAGMHFVVSECNAASEDVLRSLDFLDGGLVNVFEFKR